MHVPKIPVLLKKYELINKIDPEFIRQTLDPRVAFNIHLAELLKNMLFWKKMVVLGVPSAK